MMKNSFKKIFIALLVVIVLLSVALPVFAAVEDEQDALVATEVAVGEEASEGTTDDSTISSKAIAAATVVGIAATAGAIGMAWAIAKSVESISRQPEAEGSIRTTLMLGLVFVETAIIYALVTGILIIFVL